VSTEQNPRDRLFDPDPDTVDVRDREGGPEPVDETEDTIRDPAAHRPTVADPDQQTSEAIAEEAAVAPDDAADNRPVEDNTGDDPADERGGQEPVARDSFGPPGDEEATRFSDSPDDVTALPPPAASDNAIDRIDEERGMDEAELGEGDWAKDDLDRQSPRSATGFAKASDINGEQPSDGPPGSQETPDVEDAGALLPGGDMDRLKIRWREVQLGFVDDPRQAVDDAAEVVSLAVDRVALTLRDQVGALDADRSTGNANDGESDTERLRTLMRRYHALLDRMLAV
jgi:hypothetical protein